MLKRVLLGLLALLALLVLAVAVNTWRQGSRQIEVPDSRHFENVSNHIYKFSPGRAEAEDLARFHGTNKRISTANQAELIRFYHRLISQGAA